jgi:hypothetical protein
VIPIDVLFNGSIRVGQAVSRLRRAERVQPQAPRTA